MKKGQILSQVFILILAGAVFIMILLYGYSAIKLFNERGRQICMIDFSNKLQTAVKTIAIDAGSVDTLNLDPCEGFTEICIADADNLQTFNANAGKAHPLIRNLAESRTQNVFFFPPSDFSFFIPNMQVRKGGLCRKLEGRLSLRLEGLGNRALVSESGFETEEAVVEIKDDGFTPNNINIRIGETVTFVNHGSQAHWPASDPHPQHTGYSNKPCGDERFDACTAIQPDETYQFTFTKKGRWAYHDNLNPSMKGAIAVS